MLLITRVIIIRPDWIKSLFTTYTTNTYKNKHLWIKINIYKKKLYKGSQTYFETYDKTKTGINQFK